MKKKTVALLLALVLCAGCAVGGTVAWLMDTTETITNTFTTSDITITLEETATNFKMVPGGSITKDPKITVENGSEDCWIFVKLTKTNDADSFLEYTMATGWEVVDAQNYPGVYRWNVVSHAGDTLTVFANDTVNVKNSVTKEMMAYANTNEPTIAVTAYAIQAANLGDIDTAAEMWAQVKNNVANPGAYTPPANP